MRPGGHTLPQDPQLVYTLDKPSGPLAVGSGLLIEFLIGVIFLLADPGELFPWLILAGFGWIGALMLWIGFRQRRLLIDVGSRRATVEIRLGSWRIRRSPVKAELARLVVWGEAEHLVPPAGWGERFGANPISGLRFSMTLELAEGKPFKLGDHGGRETIEQQAREAARPLGVPAIRRGYYLGPPRPDAINRIRSEEAWALALGGGVVVTGDPADSSEL